MYMCDNALLTGMVMIIACPQWKKILNFIAENYQLKSEGWCAWNIMNSKV